MQILVLGNSDSTGAFTSGKTWSQQVRDALEAGRDDAVTVTDLPFSVEASSAAGYAEKKVRELRPEVLVLTVGSYTFTAGFTWVRVRRLFGSRVGHWYRRMEERFDSGTRHRGGVGARLNVLGRRFVRRVIGTQPISTPEQVLESYRTVIHRLAKFEDVPVILISYPDRGAHARTKKAITQRGVFFARMKEVAEQHHFRWINGQDLFEAVPADVSVHTADGLHFNEKGHEVLARAVTAAVNEAMALPV